MKFWRKIYQPQPRCLQSWRSGLPIRRSDLHRVTLSAFWGVFSMLMKISSKCQAAPGLCIGCTLPVGSADAGRSFSAFWRIKMYLQSRMSQNRLLGLALMHAHHGIHVDTKDVCQKYIQANRRRMFQSSIIRQSLDWRVCLISELYCID